MFGPSGNGLAIDGYLVDIFADRTAGDCFRLWSNNASGVATNRMVLGPSEVNSASLSFQNCKVSLTANAADQVPLTV